MTDKIEFPIRKIVVQIEEIRHEFGPPPADPHERAAIMAVVANPFAGRFVDDLQPAMEVLKPLGLDLAFRLIGQLGADRVQAYGKGAIVGANGELEHAALWHAPGGYGMREALGGAKAIVPSAKKVGGLGARLDVPIGHVDAAYVRSHFDAMELGLPDAPRPDEILFALVMTTGPRVHARMGGLAHDEVKGEDGLR